jgi:hypothetical protein
MNALKAKPLIDCTTDDAGEAIAREAENIHRVLFDGAASENLKRRYVDALQSALEAADAPKLGPLSTAGSDLEAIELALRRKDAQNPVTQRFRVVSYLAEVEPKNFDRFVAERPQFWRGIRALLRGGLRALYLALKGASLVRRHGLG